MVLDSPDNEKKNPTAPETAPPKQVSVNASSEVPVSPVPEKSTKKRTRRKTKEPKMDMSQFDAMLIGLSEYVASRPGCEHWKMTQKEVQSITEPLGNILAKSEYMSQFAEHSDAIALVFACATIFAPRIIITVNNQKEKKPKKIPVQVKKNDKAGENNNNDSDRTAEGIVRHSGNDGKLGRGKTEKEITNTESLRDLPIGMF